MGVTQPEPLGPRALRDAAEEWIVAATIATEVPPVPRKSQYSAVVFTAAMIEVAVRAVAEVIANRVASPRFPGTGLGVVLQPKQFSGAMRGLKQEALGHRDIWLDAVNGTWFPEHVQRCLNAWRRAQQPGVPSVAPGATHYYSPVGMLPPLSAPPWAATMQVVPVAGLAQDYFRFYR